MSAATDPTLVVAHPLRALELLFSKWFYDRTATNPAIAAGANVGTSPTLTIGADANDFTGTVSITVGTTPAAGELAVVTFVDAARVIPRIFFTATNAKGATYTLYAVPTAAGFSIKCNNTPVAADVITLSYLRIS